MCFLWVCVLVLSLFPLTSLFRDLCDVCVLFGVVVFRGYLWGSGVSRLVCLVGLVELVGSVVSVVGALCCSVLVRALQVRPRRVPPWSSWGWFVPLVMTCYVFLSS